MSDKDTTLQELQKEVETLRNDLDEVAGLALRVGKKVLRLSKSNKSLKSEVKKLKAMNEVLQTVEP